MTIFFVYVCLFNHLVYFRRPRVRADVDHVDSGRDERRQDETVSFLRGVAEAAAAGVPARVMQLIAEVWHRQPVDDLRVTGVKGQL